MKADFMNNALKLAQKAAALGEVPIGAVVVKNGEVIGEGYNLRETNKSILAHAEIMALENAAKALGDWRLDGCELYVTLEPCPMCAGAIINARIAEVIFGAFDKRMGSASGESVLNLFSCDFDHKPLVFGGIREEECAKILGDFFKDLRK